MRNQKSYKQSGPVVIVIPPPHNKSDVVRLIRDLSISGSVNKLSAHHGEDGTVRLDLDVRIPALFSTILNYVASVRRIEQANIGDILQYTLYLA